MNAMKICTILAGAVILSACGGSSSGSFEGGGSASLSISADSTEVPANPQGFDPDPDKDFTVQVNVRFTNSDGTLVSDGTTVNLASSNTARGVVSAADNANQTGGSASASTSGGTASFLFTSGGSTGSVTLTASANNPSGTGTVSSTLQMTVTEASDGRDRLAVEGGTSMPANTQNVGIFLGSPFINELTIRYSGSDGNAGQVADGEIGVAVSPVSRGAFSTLDDPETEDVNEFLQLMGNGPVGMTAGVATVFVHSFDQPGPLTVTVSGQDAQSGENFSNEFVIDIVEGAADFLPSQIDFGVSTNPVYITGSGGATSKAISVNVLDSGANPVPNPEGNGAEFNNVHLELVAPEGSGAHLVGTGADGSVSGSEISVQTVNGIADVALNAGSSTGPHKIIATVDRADNNVDNDLLDPFTAETTIEVGDGRLFSLEIVSPSIRAIEVNGASFLVETDVQPTVDPETGVLLPPDPDGTYSLTVTAQGTDVAGNPVLPGTPVNFGKIDAPLTQTTPRLFVFSGPDGDPEEGGNLFSVLSQSDGFLDNSTTTDEAVEPGDTLAMFGKIIPGNREHEAVRTVDSVIDSNTVTVDEPFNPNDGTGSIVDDGHVIPWAIGRSHAGVIDSQANIGEDGRASVQMTYTVDQLGRPIIVWAQGFRAGGSVTKTVADVETAVFPGIAPLLLTASPSSVPGNTTVEIRLCLTDAIGAPVNFARIRGSISGGGASGMLDGVPMPTQTAQTTGSDGDGCLITEMQTSNMLPDGEEATALFNFGAAEAEVTVVAPGAGRLLVSPSTASDPSPSPHPVNLTLTLLDPAGDPLPNVPLVGECGDGITLSSGPGTTDADGETTARVLLDLSECGDGSGEGFPRESQCTFTTSTGSPVGTFTATGTDLSLSGVSPSPCD